MLNEINQLQQFQYTIDETGDKIEQEFETTKEILEQRIYSTYSSIFQKSDLFSQYKIIEESLPDNNQYQTLDQGVNLEEEEAGLLWDQKEEAKSHNGFQFENKSDTSAIYKNIKSQPKESEIIVLDDDESFIDLKINKMYRGPLTGKFNVKQD